LTAYASELVALSPDVILAVSPLEVRAIQHQTSTVPIVFALAADPISQGIVENLAHPGGNVTGFSSFEFSMGGKWLEIFKEVAPHIHRVSLIFNPETASYMESFLRSVQAAAKTFEMEAVAAPVHDVPEMERVFAHLSGEPGNGLIFPPDVSLAFVVGRSSGWLRNIACQQFTRGQNGYREAAYWAMGQRYATTFIGPLLTWIAFSRGPGQPICPCKQQPNFNCLSI
jgi:ABC transporter substrate binding protein